MKIDIFQKMIVKYFQDIPNDTNSSLVLGGLLSVRNNGDFIGLDYDKWRIFDPYTDFVKANVQGDYFIEPLGRYP